MLGIANINITMSASELAKILQNWISLIEVVIKSHNPSGIKFRHQLQIANDAFKVTFFLAVVRIDITVKRKSNDFLMRPSQVGIVSASCLIEWHADVVRIGTTVKRENQVWLTKKIVKMKGWYLTSS